jgi:GGDEF domain-containing protein
MQPRLETHDNLTGLPNRNSIDELGRALALDVKSDLVVVVIELPPLGDDMRRTVAQRLRTCARGDDVIARIGDDCFAVLLTPRIGPEDEGKLLARLRIATGAHVLGINVAFGVARCPEDGTEVETLLAHARTRLRDMVAH